MGRTGKYQKWLQPENLILIQGWRRDGLSDKQIAKNIGVNVATIYDWCNKYTDFSNSYKKGSEVSTYEVENAAYKSTQGYYVEELEIIETTDASGMVVSITKKKHRRYIPPSTAMQIFIMKNRRPDWWKDTRTIESKSNGRLAELIDGLKEPEGTTQENDIHAETDTSDATVAAQQAEED